MLIQTIVSKISESIDELGKLLDQIYKFPLKIRENYVDEIQMMKNKLITLKSNTKDSNLPVIQKQYKQLYLNLNKLKNQIYDKLTLITNKQNKDNNRQSFKDIKKNHDNAMKILIERQQQIQRLNLALYEKQELIKINYEELRAIKQQNEILREHNQLAKYDITKIQIENSTNISLRNRAQEQALNIRLNDQERQMAFRQAISQLERLRVQLLSAHEKLQYYEQLAQISIKKTKTVEENIRMVEQQAQYLNENYKVKENETMKYIRQIQKMEFEIKGKQERNKALQRQNNRLKEDLLVMQHQLTSLQDQVYQQRMSFHQEKILTDKQISKMAEENDLLKSITQQLTQKLQAGKQTQNELKSKIYKQEGEKTRLLTMIKELTFQKQNLLLANLNIQTINQQNLKQLKSKQKEREKILEQLNAITNYYKQLEIDNRSLKDNILMAEDQRNKYAIQCEKMHLYLKQSQKSMSLNSKSSDLIQEENLGLKSQIVRLEQRLLQKQCKIQCLQKRLLRSKIQTIHELRQTLL